MKRYFTVTLRDLKVHFEVLNFYVAYLIHLSFHSFCLILGNSCITLQKNHREGRWKMKFLDCLAKTYFETKIKTTFTHLNCFYKRGDAIVFLTGFSAYCSLWEFCDEKLSKGNFNFVLRKVVRGNDVQNISIFPPKVLVFKRDFIP